MKSALNTMEIGTLLDAGCAAQLGEITQQDALWSDLHQCSQPLEPVAAWKQ